MAIGSLISGIIGLLFCGIILGPVAVILGFLARKAIAESGGLQQGQGMATAGIVLGFVAIALFFVFVAFWFGQGSPDF